MVLRTPQETTRGSSLRSIVFFLYSRKHNFFSLLPMLLSKWIPYRQLVGSYETRRLHLAPAVLQIVPVKLNLQGQDQREWQKTKSCWEWCICLNYINNLSLRIIKSAMHFAMKISFHNSSVWDLSSLQNQLFGRMTILHCQCMRTKHSTQTLQLCMFLLNNVIEKVTLWVTGGITHLTSLCRTKPSHIANSQI